MRNLSFFSITGEEISRDRRTIVSDERGARRKQRRDEVRGTSSPVNDESLPPALSRKVLAQARRQLEDDEAEQNAEIDINEQADALEDVTNEELAMDYENVGGSGHGGADGDDEMFATDDAATISTSTSSARAARTTKVLRDGKGRPVEFSSDDENDTADADAVNATNGGDNEDDGNNVVTDGQDFEVKFFVFFCFIVLCLM